VIGSRGTGRARADRLTGALLWQGLHLRGGAAFTYAWGVDDAGAQRGMLGDVFVRAEPIERLLCGVRGVYWMRGTSRSDGTVVTLTARVGWRFAPPLEVFLDLVRSLPSARAQDALPGSNFWEPRLVMRVAL